MSLINEALKKAQKLRTGDPAGTIAPMPGGGNTRIIKRSEPRSTQQLVLIASGAVVLVVLSVVATFWFINRAPAPKPAATPIVAKPSDTPAPSPVIVAPAIKPPAVVTEAPPTKAETLGPVAPSAPVTSAATVPAQNAISPAPAADVVANSAAASAPPPAAPVPTDPRVHAFVDAVKVMGIRSSGGDSRVLMNDRVFRVNDIVDRNLGVRLTKVEPSELTFTDSNGATYIKNF